jgi:hypothetical protein
MAPPLDKPHVGSLVVLPLYVFHYWVGSNLVFYVLQTFHFHLVQSFASSIQVAWVFFPTFEISCHQILQSIGTRTFDNFLSFLLPPFCNPFSPIQVQTFW